jgi:CMP-N,N'-diacetyllegionaminic acid synthase
VKHSITGLIPARAGSERIVNKNKLRILGHPMVAYSIESARQSGVFSKIILASDDKEILRIGAHYGVDEVIERPELDATSTSLDIDWLTNLYTKGKIETDLFAILRPTSPQRSPGLIQACLQALLNSTCDSVRTLSKVKEHPGKMWRVNSDQMAIPFLEQKEPGPATHALQYRSLETLYVQTSVLEIAHTRVIAESRTREGSSVLGYVTQGLDTLAIDTPDDLAFLEFLIEKYDGLLPTIDIEPYRI